jgi:hypothetical protein
MFVNVELNEAIFHFWFIVSVGLFFSWYAWHEVNTDYNKKPENMEEEKRLVLANSIADLTCAASIFIAAICFNLAFAAMERIVFLKFFER